MHISLHKLCLLGVTNSNCQICVTSKASGGKGWGGHTESRSTWRNMEATHNSTIEEHVCIFSADFSAVIESLDQNKQDEKS